MELAEAIVPPVNAGILKAGKDTVELQAGQYLQVRYGIVGNISTLFSEQVPAGKKWIASVVVNIKEEDV